MSFRECLTGLAISCYLKMKAQAGVLLDFDSYPSPNIGEGSKGTRNPDSLRVSVLMRKLGETFSR